MPCQTLVAAVLHEYVTGRLAAREGRATNGSSGKQGGRREAKTDAQANAADFGDEPATWVARGPSAPQPCPARRRTSIGGAAFGVPSIGTRRGAPHGKASQRELRRLTMRGSKVFVRSVAVRRVQQRLLAGSFPRAQMALIVLLTGGFGLLSSFILLQWGVGSMAMRYPLALVLAYLFFLFLIGLWLRTNAQDHLELPDLLDGDARRPATEGIPQFESGAGGDFGGGGASASFDTASGSAADLAETPIRSVGSSLSAAAEADELTVPLLAVALAVGLAMASLYVVYIAPVLFAEVLVDGALSYALFRYLRGHDPQHWLASTFRRTALPFAATALFLAGTGAAMSAYAPGAKSLGQVVEYAGRANAAR